jgi:hypothetical protein
MVTSKTLLIRQSPNTASGSFWAELIDLRRLVSRRGGDPKGATLRVARKASIVQKVIPQGVQADRGGREGAGHQSKLRETVAHKCVGASGLPSKEYSPVTEVGGCIAFFAKEGCRLLTRGNLVTAPY